MLSFSACSTTVLAFFWLSYIFTVIAFASIIVLTAQLYSKKATLSETFLHLPLFSVLWIYFVVQLIAGLVLMTGIFSVAISLVVQVVLLCMFAISGASALLGKNIVSAIESRTKENVVTIRSLAIEVQSMSAHCGDAALKGKLAKLAEAIRFSDPMTNGAVSVIDSDIRTRVYSLPGMLADPEKCGGESDALLLLVGRRNSILRETKCRDLK